MVGDSNLDLSFLTQTSSISAGSPLPNDDVFVNGLEIQKFRLELGIGNLVV